MKIAINHTQFSFVGGSERYIYFLCQRLLDDGHELHYFCNRKKDEFEHPNLTWHHVPRVRGIRFLKVLSFARNSAKILRESEAGPFDIIHGFSKTWHQDVYTDGSGLQSVYQDFQYRNSTAIGKFFRTRTPYQWAVEYCERKRFTRGNFHRILTMSRFVKDQLQRAYGLTDDEVQVLYNGIDCSEFSPAETTRYRDEIRNELKVDEKDCLILFCGSDYDRKNLDTLLRAAGHLKEEENLVYCVCGRDNYEDHYKRRARDLGVADRFRFCGLQPEIKKYFGAADLFVLPSYYDVFGMVVLEAMAAGVPPIVSRKAGAAEVVDEGETGAVYEPPEDDKILARKIREFLPEKKRREAGEKARKAALDYSWDNHMEKLYTVYEEVAREK